MRLFISANLNNETKTLLSEVITEFKKSVDYQGQLRFEAVENIHMTLFFIGEVPDKNSEIISKILSESVKNYKEGIIKLHTKSIGGFPNLRKPRVIFFKPGGEIKKLFSLQRYISNGLQKFGYKQDKKFNPHLTFARVKNPIDIGLEKISRELNFDIEFEVCKVSLMKSTLKAEGAEHKEIEGFEF